MKIYTLETKQELPIDVKTAWEFFSSPKNLKKITPSYMGFDITSGNLENKMYAGMIISYIVRPIFNIPVSWVTEITHVNEPNYFVDEQRFGTYSLWHHKHFLKETSGGVEMTDIVHYKIPFGLIGRIAHYFFIRKKLKEIFEFRHKKLEELFMVKK